jgi:hypothetical protein
METVWKVVIKTAEGQWKTLRFPWGGGRHLPKNQVLNAEPFSFLRDGRTTSSRGFTCFVDLAEAQAFRDRFPIERNCVVVQCEATGVFGNPVHPELGQMALSVRLIQEV